MKCFLAFIATALLSSAQSSATAQSINVSGSLQNIAVFGTLDSPSDTSSCALDLRFTATDQNINTNDLLGCSSVTVTINPNANAIIGAANGSLFVSGSFSSLRTDSANAATVISASSATSLTAASANAPLQLDGSAVSATVTVENARTTINNFTSDSLSATLINSRSIVSNSVLRAGDLVATNGSLKVQNVVSALNFKLTNTDLSARKYRILEGSRNSLRGINADMSFAGLRCVPGGSVLTTRPYASAVITQLRRNVTKLNGAIRADKIVEVNGRKRQVACARFSANLTNGNLTAS